MQFKLIDKVIWRYRLLYMESMLARPGKDLAVSHDYYLEHLYRIIAFENDLFSKVKAFNAIPKLVST
jgi:hypothetical protein